MKNIDPRQRGSAIMYIFVFVALFAFLAYMFSYGTRGNLGWFQEEQTKADTTEAQQCSNNLVMAQKRLEARGCGTLISTATDGANLNPGAPTDGSCSIYHPNGGGLKPCDGVIVASDPCAQPGATMGTVCADGTIYIGDMGVYGNGVPTGVIYAAPADETGTYRWKTTNTSTAGTTSTSNGKANTDAMQTAGLALHPAAQACRNRGPEWFILSYYEWNNGGVSVYDGLGLSGTYWMSTQLSATTSFATSGGSILTPNKNTSQKVRCFKR